MSSDDTERSPWTRPPFITAAIVIAIVVLLGVALAIRPLTQGDDVASPVPSTTPSPSATRSEVRETFTEEDESVCGLKGAKLTGTVTAAPEVEWAYQGPTAYPTSSALGPGVTTAAGVRYCFQRSPEGALLAAANAVVQGADAATSAPWLEYVLADTPARATVLADAATPDPSSDVRLNIAGFRLLSYDGTTASVDIAFRGSGGGNTVYGSAIYPLRWETGDWKLAIESSDQLQNVTQLPDLAGYVLWGA